MLHEHRPSHSKVVGVSYRYLRSAEASCAVEVDRYRFYNEELDFDEAVRISFSIAVTSALSLAVKVLQARRTSILANEQVAEGYIIGEEDIRQFAYNRLNPVQQIKLPILSEELNPEL